jgi:uncharacterized membrane protein YdjX (TVP38/TMEM64 family)
MAQTEEKKADRAMLAPALRRFWPALVLLAGLTAFLALDLGQYLSLEAVRDNREALLALVVENEVLAAVASIALYALFVAFSLPAATLLTLLAGFLFGTLLGGAIVVTGATLGAIAVFLAARHMCRDTLRRRAGPWLAKMQGGFNENAVSYMLVLRLVPLFPFFVVNIVPALLNVPLRVFALTTLVGILPGSLVYVSVGNGLGALFERGGTPDLGLIFDPEILLPLLGLAVLSLLPVAYKTWKKSRK